MDNLDICYDYLPISNAQAQRSNNIRDNCKMLAKIICNECTPTDERTMALMKLQEVMFWANASIDRE